MDSAPSEMRARLLGVKLSALVREHIGDPDRPIEPAVFPGGAALFVDRTAWVLLDERPARGLGGAVAWSVRNGAEDLQLVAESSTGSLARRAAEFALPITVWHAEGRSLLPAVAEPLPVATDVLPEHVALVDLIAEGGADPTVEHGVIAGEVRGLEVCRVVTDENTGAARLEVGIGAHDREAFALLHGDRPTVEALRDVVEAVRVHRLPDAAPHPLNRLAGERSLRHDAVADPARIGAAQLAPAAPPVPRDNVKDPVPCVAVGTSVDGRPLVAVFSSGVDLDVVPFAADARRGLHDESADVDLVIVVPERDRLPVTVSLAEMLRRPARVVGWVA